MSVVQQKALTAEEYLAMERQAEEKSEFYQGECFAMAGASRRHNILTGNSFGVLRNHLLGKPCQPYVADMRLHIEAHQHYVYPDVLVVCDEKAYVDEDNCNDATVIVEVLSPSTETYDRGQKFLHYQSLPSLQEYVLISQQPMQVEVYHRRAKEQDWIYQALSRPEDVLALAAIDFSCHLADLYESVPFPDTLETGNKTEFLVE